MRKLKLSDIEANKHQVASRIYDNKTYQSQLHDSYLKQLKLALSVNSKIRKKEKKIKIRRLDEIPDRSKSVLITLSDNVSALGKNTEENKKRPNPEVQKFNNKIRRLIRLSVDENNIDRYQTHMTQNNENDSPSKTPLNVQLVQKWMRTKDQESRRSHKSSHRKNINSTRNNENLEIKHPENLESEEINKSITDYMFENTLCLDNTHSEHSTINFSPKKYSIFSQSQKNNTENSTRLLQKMKLNHNIDKDKILNKIAYLLKPRESKLHSYNPRNRGLLYSSLNTSIELKDRRKSSIIIHENSDTPSKFTFSVMSIDEEKDKGFKVPFERTYRNCQKNSNNEIRFFRTLDL